MNRTERAGFTVVELMVAAILLGVLTALAFAIYTMGARAWAKGDARAELLRNAQIIAAKTSRLVEASTPLSASVAADGSAAAFLSAEDESGVFRYNPSSLLPRWQKFIVLYHLPAERTVYSREVPVLGTTLESAPQPIDALGGGPVESYATGGQPLALGIDECTFRLTTDGQLLTEVTSFKLRYGSEQPERQTTRFSSTLRN